MIKIELVKFEAQGVITVSTVPATPIVKPNGQPITPATPIECDCWMSNYYPHAKKDCYWD